MSKLAEEPTLTVTTRGGHQFTVTEAQKTALDKLVERAPSNSVEILGPELMGDGCLIIRFCGMIIGIETDGYTHS